MRVRAARVCGSRASGDRRGGGGDGDERAVCHVRAGLLRARWLRDPRAVLSRQELPQRVRSLRRRDGSRPTVVDPGC